jgi:hypothetical protein
MNAIVESVLMREVAMAQVNTKPFHVAALCCAGLLTPLKPKDIQRRMRSAETKHCELNYFC